MKRQMTVALGSLAILLGIIFGVIQAIQWTIGQGLANYTPPPVAVSAEVARQEQWDRYIKSVGTLVAVNGVDITSEVGGLIKQIYFASGIDVTQGQVLVQLDDTVERANLRSYDAQLKLASINYERDKKLLSSRAISKTDFDTVEAKLKDAEAQVERTRALIEQKQVKAPFAGRIGIRQLNVGDYVNVGDQLVTLQALDYLHVDFSVPEKYFPQLHNGQLVRFRVKAFGERVFEAKVTAINSKVDENTRNIRVRASFNNDAQELVPGMFANVSIVLQSQQEVITVPETAVSYSLYGDSVFVVSESTSEEGEVIKTVERRYVTVSDRRNQRVAITDGVNGGETIVTSGQLKLNNGASVVIDNSVAL